MIDKYTLDEIARADCVSCYCEETGEEYALWGMDFAERCKQRYDNNQPPEKEHGVFVKFRAKDMDAMDTLYELVRQVKDYASPN